MTSSNETHAAGRRPLRASALPARLMLRSELRKVRLAGEPWPAITPYISGTSSRIGE